MALLKVTPCQIEMILQHGTIESDALNHSPFSSSSSSSLITVSSALDSRSTPDGIVTRDIYKHKVYHASIMIFCTFSSFLSRLF